MFKILVKYVLCVLHFQMYGSMYGQKVLFMDNHLTNGKLQLSCIVDKLIYNVDFIYPNTDWGFAHCIAPTSLTKITGPTCECKCFVTATCECFITQNIDDKITVLEIFDSNSDLKQMNGSYRCQHGSYHKLTKVDQHYECPDKKADAQTNREVVFILVCTLLVTFTTGITILFFVCPVIPGRIKERIKEMVACCSSGQTVDYKMLDERDGCDMCNEPSNCGICVDCREFYCDICCKYHLKKHTEHKVYQIGVFLDSRTNMKCELCLKLAERVYVCTLPDCWDKYCEACANNHWHGKEKMTIIYQSPSGANRQRSGGVPKKINHVANMSIQGDSDPVRICGLCFIADGTVVAVDGNNHKIIAFKSKDQLLNTLKEQLEDEPCSMTAMTGNEIAITFPYQKQIRIYKINLTTTKIIDRKDEPNIIDIVSLGCRRRKPFSIAYNKGYFAVEVGEGEDGLILIIDISQKQVMKEIRCEFAYFTGHTIRLGLKMIEFKNNESIDGRLFVSAMSKKMVFCLNFDGQEKWHISDPSPRSIIVPEDDSLGDNIILSSRRSNTICQLNQQNGNYKSLKVKDNLKINSPRYIAYHSHTNRLCALVVKGKTHKVDRTTEDDKMPEDNKTPEDELVFYEFQDHEQNESSSLMDDNVEETRI